jgi:hypothetical protein
LSTLKLIEPIKECLPLKKKRHLSSLFNGRKRDYMLKQTANLHMQMSTPGTVSSELLVVCIGAFSLVIKNQFVDHLHSHTHRTRERESVREREKGRESESESESGERKS